MSDVIHATAVLAGAVGILIRGASGAGKSTLAATLIDRGARLVADDRVHLSALGGRLVGVPVGPCRGQMELRGLGIVSAPFAPAAVIRLVADLVAPEEMERMPEADALETALLGIRVARVPCPANDPRAILVTNAALDSLDANWRQGLRRLQV